MRDRRDKASKELGNVKEKDGSEPASHIEGRSGDIEGRSENAMDVDHPSVPIPSSDISDLRSKLHARLASFRRGRGLNSNGTEGNGSSPGDSHPGNEKKREKQRKEKKKERKEKLGSSTKVHLFTVHSLGPCHHLCCRCNLWFQSLLVSPL